jgi:anaerobic magnesium-protoporphyrin IX monomethyl ester cyclase
VDYVIRGEGEHTLTELLGGFRSGTSEGFEKIAGLSFKRNGQFIHNPPRPHSDLNDFPMADYLLYDDYLKRQKAIPFISSRGCPFDCRFCCSSAFNHQQGRRSRLLSLENILRDLDFLVNRYKPDVIEFIDDNFLSNRTMLAKFVVAYRERGYTFRWWARARCDFFLRLDDQLIQSLCDIGLIKIDFGVESGSQRILDLVRKRSDVELVLQAVRRAASFGLWNYCTFMNGIPGETLEEVGMSVQLRNDIMRVSPNSQVEFFVFTPLPGTELLEECQKMGFSLPQRLEDYAGYHFHHFRAPWLSAKHQRLVTAISWASFFDIYNIEHYNWYLRWPGRILKRVARWLFKHNAFGFAPEFLIANAVYAAESLKHEKTLMALH